MRRQKPLVQFFAVEIGVKLYELWADDEDFILYEFVGEGVRIATWALEAKEIPTRQEVEDEMVRVFQKTMDFDYAPERFSEIAEFIIARLELFKVQQLAY